VSFSSFASAKKSRKITVFVDFTFTQYVIFDDAGSIMNSQKSNQKLSAAESYSETMELNQTAEQSTTSAVNTKLYQEQKAACQRIKDAEHISEEMLWEAVIAFQNYPFYTISGLPFSYVLKVGKNGGYNKELLVNRRKESKSLAWSSVTLALRNALNMRGQVVNRPKALGDIRGISYIYPMFVKFGIINGPDRTA
jgi:hypothetical protein